MKHFAFIIAFVSSSAIPALAQRDFLTSDEVEKVREAQEPNERLKLYVIFAKQRMDQLQRLLEKEKKGRSLSARELLEDYARIIEAIDTVSDDALKRKTDIALGAASVSEAEQRFLSQLNRIKDKNPADLELYNVALTDAIETTSDSMELAKEDLGKRATQLTAEDEKAKQERERVIAAEESNAKKGGDDKTETVKTEDPKPTRKPPTLYRKGEKPEEPK
jgi:hypothetical protein